MSKAARSSGHASQRFLEAAGENSTGPDLVDSSISDSDEEEAKQKERSSAAVLRRGSRRKRQHGSTVRDRKDGEMTILEKRSVLPATLERYRLALARFDAWVKEKNKTQSSLTQIDAAMTEFCEARFLQGYDSSDGDFLIAAWLATRRPFGAKNTVWLPRLGRALIKWTTLTRRPLRQLLSYPAGCALACRLVSWKGRKRGAWVLIAFGGYLRPSDGSWQNLVTFRCLGS